MSHANRQGSKSVVVPPTSTTATVNNLYDDVPLTFRVAATNSAGLTGLRSAASATVDPSPTVRATNTLTLSSAPSTSQCKGLQIQADECFSFQQNSFVAPENAAPTAQPIIWIQNVLIFWRSGGQWQGETNVNIWNLKTRTYQGPPTISLGPLSYPESITLTTVVSQDTVAFYNSRVGSTPFYTYVEPSSLASTNPFGVVFNPPRSVSTTTTHRRSWLELPEEPPWPSGPGPMDRSHPPPD